MSTIYTYHIINYSPSSATTDYDMNKIDIPLVNCDATLNDDALFSLFMHAASGIAFP